ncbi:unnamed protein product [Dicrocoelium dendriticum]|nr:unnamed protein product [Dicrocoelium dendriticum]
MQPSNIKALQYELNALKQKISDITQKIHCLLKEKDLLQKQCCAVEEKLTTARINNIGICLPDRSPYDSLDGFPWSDELAGVRSRVFHIENFRPLQLRAMNATLDGKDVILVMPTGSVCVPQD